MLAYTPVSRNSWQCVVRQAYLGYWHVLHDSCKVRCLEAIRFKVAFLRESFMVANTSLFWDIVSHEKQEFTIRSKMYLLSRVDRRTDKFTRVVSHNLGIILSFKIKVKSIFLLLIFTKPYPYLYFHNRIQ